MTVEEESQGKEREREKGSKESNEKLSELVTLRRASKERRRHVRKSVGGPEDEST